MSKQERNPVIRVTAQTRKKLKFIAVYYGETMQETVERLASREISQIHIDELERPDKERTGKNVTNNSRGD